MTNNDGELQAMCCAVLWLIEQKYAAAAAVNTQRCSSNTELVLKLRHPLQCVNENTFGGVGMTHVRGHKGDPWNEMAGLSCRGGHEWLCVPSSRTELEKWMLGFRGVPVAAIWARAEMPPRCEEWTSIFEKTEELPVSVLEPKELKSLRIATLNVLTLGRKASETREHFPGSWHRCHWPAGVSSACAGGGPGRFCHDHVWS